MSAAEICSIILNKILQRSKNGCEALQKVMQLSRGLEEGGVQSLKAALEGEDDEVSKTQARVILGEYYVMKGEPAQAKEYLGPVAQDAERLRDQYDDLLDDEICRADMLLDMIRALRVFGEVKERVIINPMR